MHKKIKLTIALFAVLLIAACTSPSFGQTLGKTPSRIREVNVYTGTEGLKAEFMKNAPPKLIFHTSNFPILLRVKNNGAYDIDENNRGYLSLDITQGGIHELKFQQNSQTMVIVDPRKQNLVSFVVEGKSQINPKGNDVMLLFDAKAKPLPSNSQTMESTIIAYLCYPYKTTLSATVCIDPDIANINPVKKKACIVKDLAFGSGQGAPIAVTKIEPHMNPKSNDRVEPSFTISIENRGAGKPLNFKQYYGFCSGTSKKDERYFNIVYIKAFKSGDEKDPDRELECKPSILKFVDGKTIAECKFKNEQNVKDAYSMPLKIELVYGYEQSIDTKIVIQKPANY